jgi:DNA-binding response OmpR family regulator
MTTICVVDDDQTLLDLVAELLRERNWTMLALRDGRGAGEIVRTAAPDAILLDIRLDSDTSNACGKRLQNWHDVFDATSSERIDSAGSDSVTPELARMQKG